MYHVGAREYDPRTARWLQRDPIDAASGDPNLYRYAGNDPVNLHDPSGKKIVISANFSEKDKKVVENHISRLRNSKCIGDLIKRLEEAEEVILIEPAKNAPPEFHLESHLGYFHPTALDEDKDGIREGTIFYNPYTTFWIECDAETIPFPPDVVLAHEMGHAYGLSDPPPDQDYLTGQCIDTFENPYRKERGIAERPCYECKRTNPPSPKPEKPKAPHPKR